MVRITMFTWCNGWRSAEQCSLLS